MTRHSTSTLVSSPDSQRAKAAPSASPAGWTWPWSEDVVPPVGRSEGLMPKIIATTSRIRPPMPPPTASPPGPRPPPPVRTCEVSSRTLSLKLIGPASVVAVPEGSPAGHRLGRSGASRVPPVLAAPPPPTEGPPVLTAASVELRAGLPPAPRRRHLPRRPRRPDRPRRAQRRGQDHPDQGPRRARPAGRRHHHPHRGGRLPAAGPAHRRPRHQRPRPRALRPRARQHRPRPPRGRGGDGRGDRRAPGAGDAPLRAAGRRVHCRRAATPPSRRPPGSRRPSASRNGSSTSRCAPSPVASAGGSS